MTDFKKAAEGLLKAATMSADELAARKGENDPFVQIKRNNERLSNCSAHDFEPQPDWRSQGWGMLNRTVHCRVCGGDMKISAAHDYLRGFAHGSGRDFEAVVNAIWPPSPTAEGNA